MSDAMLSAPVAFVLLFAVVIVGYFLLGTLAPRKKAGKGQDSPYSCGEEQRVQGTADYGQFLPFAVFFTILHVAALTISTFTPAGAGSLVIAVVYVASALVGLSVLYRS